MVGSPYGTIGLVPGLVSHSRCRDVSSVTYLEHELHFFLSAQFWAAVQVKYVLCL